MDTKSPGVVRSAAAAVSGARHVRTARNGQDAACVWTSADEVNGAVQARADEGDAALRAPRPRSGLGADEADGPTRADDIGIAVVCDGCGSGATSEVGARLGAKLVTGAIRLRLLDPRTCPPAGTFGGLDQLGSGAFWEGVRADVVSALRALLASMPGPREQLVHDYFLFTTIAAVMVGDLVVVWAVGDGAYAIDGRVRVLGPFADNQPPYLGYDLLDNELAADSERDSGPGAVSIPARDPALASMRQVHLEVARADSVIIATDGVAEVGLDHFAGVDRFVEHPDALRRQLAILARGSERIDWDARRVVRTPALLQDDGAVAMLVRGDRGAS